LSGSNGNGGGKLPDHWVAGIFKKFQVRYGHKWTSGISGIEQLAVQEWAKGLAGFTGEQIATGLEYWTGDWPPSMDEFKRACLCITEPKSNDEWHALGKRLRTPPRAGESWYDYIGRIRQRLNQMEEYGETVPQQEEIARLGHD
jgi:hypothetical protein